MKNRDADYAALFAKYNRSIARIKDLEDQTASKEQAWKALEGTYKNNESLARELGEKILAKDPNEMVLGESYAWGQLSTFELMQKAKISFDEYNAKRTRLLLTLKDESEDRRLQIESLIDQLSQARLSSGAPAVNSLTGEIIDPDEIKESTKKTVEDNKTFARIPPDLKAAKEKGAVQLIVTEENDDFTEQDILDNTELSLVGRTVQLDADAAPMHISEVNREDKARRKAAQKYSELIDIEAVSEGIKPDGWDILKTIGIYGVSTTTDIAATLTKEIYKGDENQAKRTVRSLLSLQAGGILEKTDLSDGIRSKLRIYVLSPKGKKIYEHKYNKKAVVSEAEKIMAENDNYQHGYGIKALKNEIELLVDANGKHIYTSVSMDRTPNTIKLQNGKKYIADVKASNGVCVDFFEYEMGTTSATDIAIKCNKMCQVTKNIHIVYPSTAILERNAVKYEQWINGRGAKSLKGICVYLHTSKAIKKDGILNGWVMKYDCEKGATRVVQSQPE